MAQIRGVKKQHKNYKKRYNLLNNYKTGSADIKPSYLNLFDRSAKINGITRPSVRVQGARTAKRGGPSLAIKITLK